MPEYRLFLYETSGRLISRGLPIDAIDDRHAVTKAEARGACDVFRAVLRDGDRVVAEWPCRKLAVG